MRRQRNRQVHHEPSPKRALVWRVLTILGGLIFLLILLVLFVPIHLRLHLAVMDAATGSVLVYSFDDRTTTVFTIPGDTIMKTAGNLGEWPAKSLWKLGHDEKLGGKLLSRSIVKTFGVPVTHWAEPTFNASVKGGMSGFFRVLALKDTNLSLIDRANVAIALSRGVSVQVRDLSGTSALEPVTDHGEKRFIVREHLPVSFTTQFDEDEISSSVPTIGLLDGTDTAVSAQWLVKLVNVVGGRVVSHDRTEWDDVCEISGEADVVSYFVQILPCKITKESAEPFDVRIKLGKQFTQVM